MRLTQEQIISQYKRVKDPFIGGQLIQDIAVRTSPTVIQHNLGRMPVVWVLCDQVNDAVVYRDAAWTATTITLKSTSDCTISIWVN